MVSAGLCPVALGVDGGGKVTNYYFSSDQLSQFVETINPKSGNSSLIIHKVIYTIKGLLRPSPNGFGLDAPNFKYIKGQVAHGVLGPTATRAL